MNTDATSLDLGPLELDHLPDPQRRVGSSVDVLMAGVGGTEAMAAVEEVARHAGN